MTTPRTLTFTVPGRAPSKKNSQTVVNAGGRRIPTVAKGAKAWARELRKIATAAAIEQLGHNSTGAPWFPRAFRVRVVVHPARPRSQSKPGELPRPRRSDLDGILTSVLDALQGDRVKGSRLRAGGITGDDYWCIDPHPELGAWSADGMSVDVTVTEVSDSEYLAILNGKD